MTHLSDSINGANALLVKVLASITEKCKTEGENQALTVPINEPENRITFYTGLSQNTITNILSPKTFPTLDLNSRIALHDIVKCMYVQEGSLDYPGLFRDASRVGLNKTTDYDHIKCNKITDVNELIEEMTSLGYEMKDKPNNTKVLMENPEVRYERYMYLNRMKKLRNSTNSKQVVYIHERIVNTQQRFPIMWPTNNAIDSKDTIFYHAVSKKGLLCGFYSNQATHQNFCKWVTDILLGHMKEPCVIIMDNNPIHGTLQNSHPISMYHSKRDMLKWLTKNHIPCSSNMNKPALYELVKKFSKNSLEYYIDNIIRSQGHEVIRLPRFYYDLTIATPLWEHVAKMKQFGITNKKHPFDLQNTLINTIDSLGLPTWNTFDKFLEKKEREILNIDVAIDGVIDNYEIS